MIKCDYRDLFFERLMMRNWYDIDIDMILWLILRKDISIRVIIDMIMCYKNINNNIRNILDIKSNNN